MNIANDLTQAAKQEFMDRNRDLLALTKAGSNDVFRRIAAALALDTSVQTDCLLYVDAIDQRGFAGDTARGDFKREMYRAICKSFLRCQNNFVIEFVAKLTPEALAQLEAIEVAAGVRQEPAPVAPPPPPKTPQELLTEEVLRDWKFLPATKVRHKLNNKMYKAEFDRLMSSGQLESQITSLHDHGAEFRP
jgi:hypothetical protein